MRNLFVLPWLSAGRRVAFSVVAASILAWISTEKNPASAGLTQGIHLTRYFGADSTQGVPTNIGIAKGFI